MARATNKLEFQAFGYVTRPRRTRTKGGVQESYWTVRNRRQDEAGEWSLGWFPGVRQAEQAFHKWLDEHRKTPMPTGGTATMTNVIERYIEMVPTMGKRPNTRANRVFRARKLRAFVEMADANMTIGEFDDGMFAKYLSWLRDTLKHRPQTISNLLIGARTLLRWAVSKKWLNDGPKVPDFRVPPPNHEALFAEDVEATIAKAEAPLDLMLKLMWETGLRVSEAATTRGCDLLVEDRLVMVQERDDFVPKTDDSERRVPVSADLMDQLRRLAVTPEGPLFPSRAACTYHYWLNRLNKAQKAAGVREFTFHALRRAVADRLRKGGVPMDRYAKFMGHAPITALRHYSTVTTDDLHDALEVGLGAARRRKVK
ncbi:hypothetical protein FJZ55_10020 [Candidatus Woesearchaeota archaeon]|nr:hypothetical protein [Candidatus Woesearchaeota archaeon]